MSKGKKMSGVSGTSLISGRAGSNLYETQRSAQVEKAASKEGKRQKVFSEILPAQECTSGIRNQKRQSI